MSNDVWILAITRGHNGGGCLLKNGKIVFSSEEERFSRVKYDGGPMASIVKAKEFTDRLDYMVISHTVSMQNGDGGIDYTGDNMYVALARKLGLIDKIPSRDSSHHQVIDVGHIHHKMHAACAFYKSGFKNATVVIVDGAGSFSSLGSETHGRINCFETESIIEASYPDKLLNVYKHMGTNDGIGTIKQRFEFTDPLFKDWHENFEMVLSDRAGIVKTYEGITEYCGFSAIEAGKTMGLFPYGNPDDSAPMLFEDYDNGYTLSNRNAIIPRYPMSSQFNARLYSDYGFTAYGTKEYDLQNRKNAAYAVQTQSQKQVANLIRKAYEMTGNKNIVLSGGYGLNCVANYYYLEELKDLDINLYVEPISSDAGTAIGAALLWWYHKTQSEEIYGEQSLYLGIDYNISREDVYNVQSKYHIGVDVKENVEYEDVIDLVTNKNIVALFQGRSESGPRALGNRSIIYDPTDPNGKDFVNKVKRREYFRPFAGSILKEDVHEWFDLRGMDETPHMMYAVNCQPGIGIEEKIPSIIHEDGTCRIQTVTEEQNPNYYNLIKKFKEKTGVPIVFNTSFNLGGEPLVETLDDAVRTIVNSKIEYLYLPELKILVTAKNASI